MLFASGDQFHHAILLGLLLSPAVISAQPCDAPEADPWIKGLSERVLSLDSLGVYAVEKYGAPLDCSGEVSTEFDGLAFGFVQFRFAGGALMDVATYPPESSIVALTDSTGFEHDVVRSVLEGYAKSIGLSIDWDVPSITSHESERTLTYTDPDEGLNASASLIFHDRKLVSVRLSLAL